LIDPAREGLQSPSCSATYLIGMYLLHSISIPPTLYSVFCSHPPSLADIQTEVKIF
jgi:hypothetical protein